MKVNSSRRALLRLFGLAGACLLASRVKVGGTFIAPSYKDDEVPGIPDDWFILDNNVHRYGNYLLTLKLKHITPYMIIAPHFKTRGRVKNSIPPKSMWKRVGPTLKVIDKLCDEIGEPVKEIVSVYRSPGYNKAVRGNRGSYHMSNQAIDVMFNKTSPWKVARAAKQMRNKKVFKGGIGRYRHFVHIDTRGVNADW